MEIAINSGVPQHELERRFTYEEMVEIIAYHAEKRQEPEKDDYRFGLLTYFLLLVNTEKRHRKALKVEDFILKWDKAAEQHKQARLSEKTWRQIAQRVEHARRKKHE